MANKITIGGVDVTDRVRAMFELAIQSRDHDNVGEPTYDDEGLEGMLLVAHLAGFEVPGDFRLATEPVEPKRPEPPPQQYESGGELVTRSSEELREATRIYDQAISGWRERQDELVRRTRGELLARVRAEAEELAAAADE